MIVLQNAPEVPAGFPGLTAEFLAVDSGAAKLDLALSWLVVDGALLGSLEYRPDLFDRPSVQRMAGHLDILLRAALAAPERRLADLPLLTAPEAQQLREWNATGEDLRQDLLLHPWLRRQAAATPDAVAVVCAGESLSYRGLQGRARRLARRLRVLGVAPDVPVAICAERSLELVIGLLAILEAGGAYVPLDPSYPRERLDFMLEDALAAAPVQVLLIQEHLLPLLAGAGAAPSAVRPAVVLLAAGADGAGEPGALAAPAGPAAADRLAYVIYTSGSTGRPKGAMNTHRALCNRLLWMQREYGLDGSDRVLQKTPVSFDVSVWELFWPLMTGACMVLARPEGHRDSA